MGVCSLSIVTTPGLVLKHQANIIQISIASDQFKKYYIYCEQH